MSINIPIYIFIHEFDQYRHPQLQPPNVTLKYNQSRKLPRLCIATAYRLAACVPNSTAIPKLTRPGSQPLDWRMEVLDLGIAVDLPVWCF